MLEESKKGFFEDNEGIFLISSNFLEKQQIEDGVNREIHRIVTVADLIEAFTELSTVDGVRASVIITSEIPPEISKSLEDVKEVLEVSAIPVFEIGMGELVEGAYRFGTINDFLLFVRNNRRKARISEVKDEEQKEILQELQIESDARLERIKDLEEQYRKKQEELEEYKKRFTSLQTKVDQVYKVQRDNAVSEYEKLKEQLENVNRLYGVEKEKSEQYRKEKDNALGELTEIRLNSASLETVLRERQETIKKLEKKIDDQDKDIDKLIREKEAILSSKVDAEEIVVLNKELDNLRKTKENLEEELVNMEIENRKLLYEKELIEGDYKVLQEGKEDIKEYGRTVKLDTYKFNNVDLVYIKVFEWMPYMRLALQMFFEEISGRVEGRSHMMIMRYDDGMDGEYFKGMPLWSRLRDVPASDKVFRMFPNPAMFVKLEEWERRVNLLVVVDNIKNNNYYLETRARESVMTVVRRSTDIKKYGLRGKPITLDGDSVYDITEDSAIKNAGLKVNRHRMLKYRVKRWVDRVWEE